MTAATAVRITNLRKEFDGGRIAALRDVSLDVPRVNCW